jgi:serine/threonine protein kinase
MAKVFTITPGLENMGGLKTGGQGSIYKGRRIGEIITAIKILPTPIYSESAEDQNYIAFQNEVSKLKKVNEIPNPNVVKILSSGISDTGNFPFIEMEYIEGPDLEELLQTPGHPVFTINETLKVAEQLSYALGHCHRLDVRHGDVKSNNVKYNLESGNYVLLDFGLAIMSDDQRRSNLRYAGAIEFMAPEQNSGQMLFQTDIYSFGVIIFELLTGTVPFKLKGNGESARNEVRLAHMVSPVPNLIDLRREALPDTWDNQKKEHEMRLPETLIKMVNKCLEKKPEKRFADGKELHDYIVQQIICRTDSTTIRLNHLSVRPLGKQDFIVNQEQLNKQVLQLRDELIRKEAELSILKERVKQGVVGIDVKKENSINTVSLPAKNKRVSKTSFAALLFLTIALGAFSMYPFIKSKILTRSQTANNADTTVNTGSNSETDKSIKVAGTGKVNRRVAQLPETQEGLNATNASGDSLLNTGEQDDHDANESDKSTETAGEHGNESTDDATKPVEQTDDANNTDKKPANQTQETENNSGSATNAISKKYLVVSKAYFYNEPNEESKRHEFISPSEKAIVQALNERYGFIYVVISTPQGQVFKGWLRKRELKLHSTE